MKLKRNTLIWHIVRVDNPMEIYCGVEIRPQQAHETPGPYLPRGIKCCRACQQRAKVSGELKGRL